MRPLADGSPEALLAEGFARHVRQWALSQGADAGAAAAAARAAMALSLATSAGHVCLVLAELGDPGSPAETGLPADTAAWRGRLLASSVVGTPDAPGSRPLILDDEDRLYLHRHFDFERRLARRLVRCAAPLPAPDAAQRARTAQQLATLFAGNSGGADQAIDWQQLAAALALRGRLTIISGGPGTGKTTTVVNLLACLLAQQPDARVVLAAPTGKAAARLAEALRGRAAHLAPELQARLPTEAFTVHRLLGVRPEGAADADGDGPFVHHAGHPLALDALVVDEASMLDLALATRLFEAVPDHARIVLLGDKDQLSAVESGAVFAELSADPSLSPAARSDLAALCGVAAERIVPAAPLRASTLHDSVVWFNRNFRFAADSGIGRLAADTVAGRADAALAWLRSGDDPSVQWLADAQPGLAPATLAALVAGYAPYLAALQTSLQRAVDHHLAGIDVAGISEAFSRFRVLCAVRDGPRGVAAINEMLGRHLRLALADTVPAGDPRSPWFVGRPVMVLRNDPVLKLFNGDIGITLPAVGGGLLVYFPAADGGFRAVAPLRLPAHQTALAMTVHKSQGSEFDAVAVLLPAQRSRVLSRELLYTAITRARRQVLLAAPPEVLAAAIGAGTQRHSGLLARLRDAMAP
jgi:exodeoxyribonuclease V alpha subunit